MKADTNFSDEAKLTAYALGELDGDERAAVEARLRGDPAALAAVAELRATAARLEAALAGEPVDMKKTNGNAEAAIETGVDPRKPGGGGRGLRPGRVKAPRLLRREAFYYVVGGLAAACLALVIIAERSETRQRFERKAVAKPEAPKVMLMELPRIEPPNEMEEAEPALVRAAPAAVSVPLGAPAMPRGGMADFHKGVVGGATVASNQAIGTPPGAEENRRYAAAVRRMSKAKAGEWGGRSYFEQAVAQMPRRNEFNTEAYAYRAENEFLAAAENPLSTFSADVDTASYANVRRFIEAGRRPPADAVRIEELVNYFPYRYAAPASAKTAWSDGETATPFAATMEVAEAPWAAGHRLVRIGLKGREVAMAARGAANLVFLLDVSGSMNQPNKLPLVKESLHLLLGRLRADDRVAIVTYAGASGLALASTPAAKAHEIAAALDELQPEGSTNGAMGIQLAYDIAKANFVSGGINRVILCTDGDFNVGVTSEGELVRLIKEKAKTGVFLTVLGFGMGNYRDSTLQQLADAGNGNYGYIDTRREAEKLLVEQVSGTLVTIAKDVKLQVEFNPALVASYRLIGYEKRLLKKEDFNNDKVDAGEIGSGHAVTALYEIVPAGASEGAKEVDPLKYSTAAATEAPSSTAGAAEAPSTKIQAPGKQGKIPSARDHAPESEPKAQNPKLKTATAAELLTLKVRYKEPAGEVSRKLEFPLVDGGARFEEASDDFQFAAAVAAFGMVLRESPERGTATLADVARWAEAGAAADSGGYRAEFVALVKKAERLP